MSSSDRATLDFDVLLAATPFGLFDCEDLVLVDAVRQLTRPERLAAAIAQEKLLLGWYYAEQGSYAKARGYVTDAPGLGAILSRRLQALGQLEARFIRHSPEGNGNRYEPLIEERFPKLVTADDDVLVRALASPLPRTIGAMSPWCGTPREAEAARWSNPSSSDTGTVTSRSGWSSSTRC